MTVNKQCEVGSQIQLKFDFDCLLESYLPLDQFLCLARLGGQCNPGSCQTHWGVLGKLALFHSHGTCFTC